MDKLYNISKTAEILDVTPKTLRVWDKENKLKPILTSGGHRRYRESDINKIIGTQTTNEIKQEICATYARVSSQKQKASGYLDKQSHRLSEYCAKHNLYVEHIIKDCGSGLNDKRQGFVQLTDLVVKGKVNKVIIEHKDRLTRFQFNFIQKMYGVFGCNIVVLDDKEDISDEEELTRDLMALLASFSGKYYGRRSLERRKQNKKFDDFQVISNKHNNMI